MNQNNTPAADTPAADTPAAQAFSITAQQFETLVRNITRSGAAYSKGIGHALLGALYFSIVHKDAAPANTLVGALRKSTKQQAIIALLEENGNLAWTKLGKKPGFAYFDAMQTWMPEDVELLRTVCTGWELYKAVKIEAEYDVVKAIDAIVKAIDTKTKHGKTVIGHEMKGALVAALAQYTSAKYGEMV